MSPITVFFSYSPADASLCEELQDHLALMERQQLIAGWYDRLILPGQDWKAVVDRRLNQAKIVLLLVSSDFIASDYCYGIEMARALERRQRGECEVVPILLRDCDWTGAPFACCRVLPETGTAISNSGNRDQAWANIARSIRCLVSKYGPTQHLVIAEGGVLQRAPNDAVPFRGARPSIAPEHRFPKLGPSQVLAAQPEVDLVRRCLVDGYVWLFGPHGIGKTTLIRQALSHPCFDDWMIWYFDCRAEALAFKTPAEALLDALGVGKYKTKEARFRALRRVLVGLQEQYGAFVVFDEIDAFPRRAVIPFLQFFAAVRGVAFISCAEPSAFRAVSDDSADEPHETPPSQPPPRDLLEVLPLPQESAEAYFSNKDNHVEVARELARLSGGNPTLMKLLASVRNYESCADLFSVANRRTLLSIYQYFEMLWDAFGSAQRDAAVIVARSRIVARSSARSRKAQMERASNNAVYAVPRSLRNMELGRWVVSPLFALWVLENRVGISKVAKGERWIDDAALLRTLLGSATPQRRSNKGLEHDGAR